MRRLWLTALALLLAGCQPAMKYGGKPAPSHDAPPPPAAGDAIDWLTATHTPLADVPIVFVHEADAKEWAALPRYWNLPADPLTVGTVIGLGPGLAPPVADVKPAVRVKVPAGLDEPPANPANPPTLRKWDLGRRLFFDPTWLTDKGDVSCASCHIPKSGFADNVAGHDNGKSLVNTPTLVNCAYNSRQFWDGRVATLEEVVQRTVADETTPAKDPGFRHVWPGVVGRLRQGRLQQHFQNVFGCQPTQDAVGRALATYLRTILAGDSLYDRALAEAKGKPPEAAHFEKHVTDDFLAAARKMPGQEKADKAAVAAVLLHGYRLFMNQDEHTRTNCVACHGGREFTDRGFHNVDVGWRTPDAGHYPGYFPNAPIGQKSRDLIGAYKTPTLRGLLRTAPYFHDGSGETLAKAVRFHTRGWTANLFIDPELWDVPLVPDEETALLLFLQALNGEEVDAAVATPPSD
jgi:cytochrome c peroxidase